MSHTVDTTTTDYSWDVTARLPVVLQDGTNTYVYGLDLIAATDGSDDPAYFTYDGLGSTSDLTDASADSVDAYTYDAFGAIRSQSGSSSNYLLFTGEQFDDGSDLYFLRERYYDPGTGRFLGKDPLDIGNRYSYVSNNPVNFVDPYGLFGFKDIKKAAGGVAQAVGDAAVAVAPYAGRCAAWGGVGLVATGSLGGAAVGCATGVGSYFWQHNISDDPISQCVIWGLGAAIGPKFSTFNAFSSHAGAAGCFTGALSWLDTNYGQSDIFSQCGVWGAGGFAGSLATSSPSTWLGITVAACVAGATTQGLDDLLNGPPGSHLPNSPFDPSRQKE